MHKSNKLPVDFDWKVYVELNEDLHNFSKMRAISHYKQYGYAENRKYSFDKSECVKDECAENECAENECIENELKINCVQNKIVDCDNIMLIISAKNILDVDKILLKINFKCNVMLVTSNECISEQCEQKIDIILHVKYCDDESLHSIISYDFLIKNKIKAKWMLFINYSDNKNMFDDLLCPLLQDDVVRDINNDNFDDISCIGSSLCKTHTFKYINTINDIFKRCHIDAQLIDHCNDCCAYDKHIYWKYNIDLKYNIENINDVDEHYNTTGKYELNRTFNLFDVDKIKDNFYHVMGNVYWIKYDVIVKYNDVITYLLTKTNSMLHRKSSELIFQILSQICDKMTFTPPLEIPLNFNYEAYVGHNHDLNHMNIHEAIEHYNNYGIKENRTCSYDKSFVDDYVYKINKFNDDALFDNYFNNLCIKNKFKISYNTKYVMKQIKNFNCESKIYVNKINENKFSNYFVIINFSDAYVGGTKFFLDTILNLYQKNNTYIIICPNKNNYDVKINGNYMYTCDYDVITKIINNAKKIIINSIVGYEDVFIEFLHKKKKIIFTHDYNIVSQKSMVHFGLFKTLIKKTFINASDIIITQNTTNIGLFDFVHDITLNTIYELPLPDYVMSNNIIHTNNDKIMIMFIGGISGSKGLYFLEYLYDNYSHIYNFFVAGTHNSLKKIRHQKYNSIMEFNRIIKIIKPNIVMFASLWPETYSYTLTLAMCMNIPIISCDIGSCVIQNRLMKYGKGYFFNSIDKMNNLITQKSQNYYHLIDNNEMSVSTYYDNIFTNNCSLFYENVVVITSKIICNSIPYTYGIKTNYTTEERYIQTLKTISSVRTKIKDCFIIFVDTDLSENYKKNIQKLVDVFINANGHIINIMTNYSNLKIFGELNQMSTVIKFIKKFPIKFNNLFKLTGRYFLNDKFDYDVFNNKQNIFKQNENVTDRLYYYTSLYKISYDSYDLFCNNFISFYNVAMTSDINENSHFEYENIIPSFVDFIEIDVLGVTQIISSHSTHDDV